MTLLDRMPCERFVAIPPLPHGGQDRPEVTTLVGQAVVVPDRPVQIPHPLKHAGIDQLGEPLLKDVA